MVNQKQLEGTVLWGANNIFSVFATDGIRQCRIKGKVLDTKAEREHNVLCPGDNVFLDPVGTGEGVITERLARKNAMVRCNRKTLKDQSLGANIDQVLVLFSTTEPPFRPRFIDRVLMVCAWSQIPVSLIHTKADLGMDQDDFERLAAYAALGYSVSSISVANSSGLDEIRELLTGKRSLLAGQSGVGKSSFLNHWFPDAQVKTAAVSKKHNRGAHTTTLGRLYHDDEYQLIDTPGMREFYLPLIPLDQLHELMPEFRPLDGTCEHRNCMHIEEEGCAVDQLLESGAIHPDRYESYQRMVAELRVAQKDWTRLYG